VAIILIKIALRIVLKRGRVRISAMSATKKFWKGLLQLLKYQK
jgi:hypothetical protein